MKTYKYQEELQAGVINVAYTNNFIRNGFYNWEGIIVLLDRLAAYPGCDVLIEKLKKITIGMRNAM